VKKVKKNNIKMGKRNQTMNQNPSKFKDDGRTQSDFFNSIYVQCPQCEKRAHISRPETETLFAEVHLRCPSCGQQQEKKPSSLFYHHDKDVYFGLPLWLQIYCCGHTLAFYNDQHLAYVKAFVQAKIREGITPDPEMGFYYRNRTLISCLPKWIQAKENRQTILKAMQKLEKKLF